MRPYGSLIKCDSQWRNKRYISRGRSWHPHFLKHGSAAVRRRSSKKTERQTAKRQIWEQT